MKSIKRIQPLLDSTLALQCYDQLQDYIIDGIFAPGQKLRVEELKEQLGIGQSPIREALSRLVASGLVETEENKGFRVARISESDVRDTYRTYLAIELLALKQAIELGDDSWGAHIVATLYQLGLLENKHEPVPYRTWADRNYAFHVALISGCNSPLLLQIRADVYKRFDRYCRIAFNLAGQELHLNHQEHTKMADAVLQRDFKLASDLMTYHIMGALEDVITTLKKNNLL